LPTGTAHAACDFVQHPSQGSAAMLGVVLPGMRDRHDVAGRCDLHVSQNPARIGAFCVRHQEKE